MGWGLGQLNWTHVKTPHSVKSLNVDFSPSLGNAWAPDMGWLHWECNRLQLLHVSMITITITSKMKLNDYDYITHVIMISSNCLSLQNKMDEVIYYSTFRSKPIQMYVIEHKSMHFCSCYIQISQIKIIYLIFRYKN